jgi:hypothetical protein
VRCLHALPGAANRICGAILFAKIWYTSSGTAALVEKKFGASSLIAVLGRQTKFVGSQLPLLVL